MRRSTGSASHGYQASSLELLEARIRPFAGLLARHVFGCHYSVDRYCAPRLEGYGWMPEPVSKRIQAAPYMEIGAAVSEIRQACAELGEEAHRSPFFLIVGAGVSYPPVRVATTIIEHCKGVAAKYARQAEARPARLDTYNGDGTISVLEAMIETACRMASAKASEGNEFPYALLRQCPVVVRNAENVELFWTRPLRLSPYSKLHALIVAISEYPGTEASRAGPLNDAADISRLLQDRGNRVYNEAPRNVVN